MTFEQTLKKYKDFDEEYFVIGGSKIFDLFLPYTRTIYLTIIDAEYDGDVYFSSFDKAVWKQVSEKHFNSDERNLHDYTFLEYSKTD
jgi:dihydrofolate reductase